MELVRGWYIDAYKMHTATQQFFFVLLKLRL